MYLRRCTLDLCVRTSHDSLKDFTCDRHASVTTEDTDEVIVECGVLRSPTNGDDVYLYGGVEYHVQAKVTRLSVVFIGSYVPSKSNGRTFVFRDDDGYELKVAFDAIREIWAT